MRLSLLTYNMAKNWDLPRIVDFARLGGFAGVEFRAEASHKHGVELEASAQARRDARQRIEDAYLEVACIGLSSRFDTPDAAKRREVVERTKRYVELAADVGCRRLRVFGNDMPKAGVDGDEPPPRETVAHYVGDALRELAEFAEPHRVDILLEMHGQFNYWGFARPAVEHAAHPGVGIVYNCDTRDLVAGSVASTYNRVRHLIRHVHMHEFTRGFPYPELFGLLQRDGYDGYLSSELGQETPPPEDYLLLYAQLFRAWNALAAATGPAALPAYAVATATATRTTTR
ncbi:MAG: sugar phosphate isomerase/epimerase family protein [Chloroflexota bacterium]